MVALIMKGELILLELVVKGGSIMLCVVVNLQNQFPGKLV